MLVQGSLTCDLSNEQVVTREGASVVPEERKRKRQPWTMIDRSGLRTSTHDLEIILNNLSCLAHISSEFQRHTDGTIVAQTALGGRAETLKEINENRMHPLSY